jgi:SpoVK/Ycf46/Vps4 family AAA+-type ATPase
MLRFIVPGMLPKLQRLKKHGEKNGLIFIVATNFKERLDSAIVRPGRIDHDYLVPPYDQRSRAWLLEGFLTKAKVLPEDSSKKMQVAHALSWWTQGWVYKEIEGLADRFANEYDTDKSLQSALQSKSKTKITELLLDRLKVKKPESDCEGYTFEFVSPGLKRALDPQQVYKDRDGAAEERKVVMKICSAVPN